MKLKLRKYKEQLQNWPQKGFHIMAQYDEEKSLYINHIGKKSVSLP